jgi:hypothetical protein
MLLLLVLLLLQYGSSHGLRMLLQELLCVPEPCGAWLPSEQHSVSTAGCLLPAARRLPRSCWLATQQVRLV